MLCVRLCVAQLKVMDSIIRETLRIHAPIHSSTSASSSCTVISARLLILPSRPAVMRKVIGDIPVPTSLAAPSESSSYVIPKVSPTTLLGHPLTLC